MPSSAHPARNPGRGPSVYTALEVSLTAGLFVDSAVAGRVSARLRLPAPAAAIFVVSATILTVGFTTALGPAAGRSRSAAPATPVAAVYTLHLLRARARAAVLGTAPESAITPGHRPAASS